MKNIIFTLSILILFGCGQSINDEALTQSQQELSRLQDNEKLEQKTKEGIERYIADVEAVDWRTRLEKQKPGDEKHMRFLDRHQRFRDAYQNLNLQIKHLTIDGEEALIWLEVTATHAGTTEDVIKNVKPTGLTVKYEEVWFFNMRNGLFGDKWDIITRGLDKMKSVRSYHVPDDYFEIEY